MWYLLNAYWIPLLLAGMLGVIIGWMSCNNEPNRGLSTSGWFSGWLPWAVAGAALAALAAVQTLLQGKQGLLLDTALMLFGAYMIGCCIGCILKPKPAAHLAHVGARATGKSVSGTSGKVASAAAVGSAATAAAANRTAARSALTTAPVGKSATTARATPTTTPVGKSDTAVKPGAVSTLATSISSAAAADKGKSVVATTGSATNVSDIKSGLSGRDKVVTASGAAATGAAVTVAATASKATNTATSGTVSAPTGTASTASHAAVGGTPDIIKVFSGAPKFGERPVLYSAPRSGKGDDLSLIWGVAEKLEHKMNAAGVWHFDQIANWTSANIDWFEHEFEGFKGRLDRDKWVEQCKKLAAGWRPDGHIGHQSKG